MPILRKLIAPELLPVLARAQFALSADIMRKAAGGDLIAKVALRHFRFLGECTEDLVELTRLYGSETYIVSFYDSTNSTYLDRQLIDWAVEFYVEESERISDEEWHAALALKAAFEESDWQEWGR